MIQQLNPEKVFTGEGNDKIGPGHYDIKKSAINKNKGTNWHLSNVGREFTNQVKKETEKSRVGPGSYEVNASGIVNKYRQIKNREIGNAAGRNDKNHNGNYGMDLIDSVNESDTDSICPEVTFML